MTNPIMISFGGGKGGIGKSTICANIGTDLARRGYSVVFIDADLAGANLHLHLGIRRPTVTLSDYLQGKVKTITEALTPTSIPDTRLLSGAGDFLDMANPRYAQKQKLINGIRKIDADFILIDIGAGTSANSTDFFTSFSNGVIIYDGLPASVENSYSFLKNGIIRGIIHLFPPRSDMRRIIEEGFSSKSAVPFASVSDLLSSLSGRYPDEVIKIKKWLADRRTLFILNMARDKSDFPTVTKFPEVIKKYLNCTIHYIGYLVFEEEIRISNKKLLPFVAEYPESGAAQCIATITDNLLKMVK